MKSTQQSRRTFMKTAAAAMAAPTILAANARGQAAPSNKVTLALIGAGNRGTSLVSEFVNLPDAKFLAICDCFKDRREKVRDNLNQFYGSQDVKAYADFEEVLARDDIDAVIVATPDHWHVPLAVYAARAGKDMYVEKPLGVAMQWAWQLRDVLKQHDVIFQYGTMQRNMPPYRQMHYLIQNGYVGEPERAELWCPDISQQYEVFHVPRYGSTEPVAPPEGFDYERWLGPAPRRPYTVDRCTAFGAYHIYDYALGFIAGWGAHPLDAMQWMVNKDDTGPVCIEASGELPKKGLYDTIETWDTHCTYADGFKVRFMDWRVAKPVVTYRPYQVHGTTIFGPDGWVSCDRGAIFASNPAWLEEAAQADEVRAKAEETHASHFVARVKDRKTPTSSFEAAVRSDTISHLCDIAIRMEQPIDWDPEKEQIINGNNLDAMLDRPLRAPWRLDEPTGEDA